MILFPAIDLKEGRVVRLVRGDMERATVGTAAVRDPEFVREACRRHPGRIAVGIDARGGMVAVEGWSRLSEMRAEEMARAFADAGVAAIIYTDIERDGALKGLNIEATLRLARLT